jgi:two-component system response regulator RegA
MDKHVLILEDDLRLAKSLLKEFIEHGYKATTAESLADFLIKLEADKTLLLDFAVLDLRLSKGGNGLEALEKILQIFPQCRLVVLTGYASVVTAVEAVKKGAVDYLTKPASFQQIEAALLGQRKLENLDLKRPSLDQIEHEYIDFVLQGNNGNISKTARDLGLHRQSLQRKLKKYI